MWLLIFARKNWQAIAVALIISVVWWRINAIVDERDKAIAALNAQTNAIDAATAEQRAKNAELKRQGLQSVAAIEAQHIKDIQYIGQLYGKAINNDKASIHNLRTELANSLRQQSAQNDRARVSENDTDRPASDNSNAAVTRPPEESAEYYKQALIGAERYIYTLHEAGAVCAADYNMCKAYVDSEQRRLGVELLSNP